MKVVVTGGAGYLGSVATRELLNQGHQVTVLDSLMHGGQAIQGLYLYDDFNFVRGDIRSTEVVNRVLEGADAVVHLAAIVGDPACARKPDLTREINLDGSLQIFNLSQEQGVKRFVFASTCSNYGKMEDPSKLATEESELQPLSLYAETKVAVERALLDTGQSQAPTITVMRFATLFGLTPRMRFDLTVNEFTAELITRQKLEVFGQQFWRPYVHVRDAARAIARVLDAPIDSIEDQVFNVGDTGENYQKGQLVDVIRVLTGNQADIQYIHRDEDPRDYRVGFEKIQHHLGFQITRTVEHGVREIIDAIEQGVISEPDDPRYRN